MPNRISRERLIKMLGYEPRDSNPEIVTQSLDEKLKNPIQLSEDLLFIVNKKLRSIDKAKRDSRIEYEEGNSEEHGEIRKPFTEVVYRKSCGYNMSETQKAVMHKISFDSTSMALCEVSSMQDFMRSLDFGIRIKSVDFHTLVSYKRRNTGAKVPWVSPLVRFIQFPEDYYRPQSDCAFFGELAWKENGVMMVNADNFALCMVIWKLKDWIVSTDERSYPLPCQRGFCSCCFCYSCPNLLHALQTDVILRQFFDDQGIGGDINDLNSYKALERAKYHMQTFCRKLITGEDTISRSSRSFNLNAAIQLQKILQELSVTLVSTKRKVNRRDSAAYYSDESD